MGGGESFPLLGWIGFTKWISGEFKRSIANQLGEMEKI